MSRATRHGRARPLWAGLTAAALCVLTQFPATASVAAVTTTTTAGASATSVPAPRTALPTEPTAATEDFGACVAGGGTADVILLVDESSSLLSSDPGLARVTAATYFVNELARFSTAGDRAINVQLSVFGDSYSTVLGWTALTDESVNSVRAGIAGLADRVDGFDTDYWTALDGARIDLAAQAAARSGETNCQAIVWFTDGKLDFFPRTTDSDRTDYGTEKIFAPGITLNSTDAAASVKKMASDDLCRDGGLADQLRSSGIRLFGVLLSGSTSKPGDFDFIESVIAGTSGSGAIRCGALTEPAPGEFHLATDIDSMLFAFDAFGSPGAAPITQEAGVCQTAFCSEQAHTFVLDISTPDVRVLATADVAGLDAAFQLPTGDMVALPRTEIGAPSALTVAGASVSYVWESEKTVSVSITKDAATDAAWSGLWLLAFTDPAGTSPNAASRSNIHISGSLMPAWIGHDSAELFAGDTVDDVVLGLVDRAGTRVDPASLLGTVTYSAVFQDNDGTATTLVDSSEAAQIGEPLTLNLQKAAIGPALLTLRLGITTAGTTLPDGTTVPGTTLEPSIVAVPLTVRAPLDYPTIASLIDFGDVTGAADVTATLPIAGDGCVWLPTTAKPTIVASPADLGATTVVSTASTRETCASIADGLVLALATGEGGNGTLNGSITVQIAPTDAAGDPIEVVVDFTASLHKPLNATNFWIALATALLLGPGIPLLILYLAKWLVSKIPARSLAGALVPITVVQGEVLRAGERFALTPADQALTVPIEARGSRRLRVESVELRTRLGLAPAGAGHVLVVAPGRVSAGSAEPSTDHRHTSAVLPLGVHNHWVVLHTPGTPANTAEVLLLIAGDASVDEKNELQGDLNQRLPGVLEALVAAERPADATESATAPVASDAPSRFISAPAPTAQPSSNSSPWAARP